jgi:hypothetical protein
MKWIIFLIGLCILPFLPDGNVSQIPDKNTKSVLLHKSSEIYPTSNLPSERINQAWNVSWKRFYNPGTQLFYDYLTSYDAGNELAHLPTADEVSRQYPNTCGYGTGMEDCMISAGVMLCMIVDKYSVTKNEELRKNAYSVFQGIKRCATVHGVPGFLARGVCPEDIRSIYINSSRDQYTHAVYGLWHYFHSSLCDPVTKTEIGKILSAFADRMIQNVTPENDFNFLCADGTPDTRGICKMWNVKGHEAARLPMFYAAAWNTTGNLKYFELYRKYLKPAILQSYTVEEKTPTYALLQMQSSLELLESLEKDTLLKNQMHEIMTMVSQRCAIRGSNADGIAHKIDLTMVGSDWRNGAGLDPKGEYRKVWYCIRESGEAALAQLMYTGKSFPEDQKMLLTEAITRLDYNHVSSSGIFYLQGAYWKARRLGMFKNEKE